MDTSSANLQGSEEIKDQERRSAGNKEENKQSQRVAFNPGEITVVRRPGEGSRPLFDRDEILNHDRISDEERRRCRRRFSQSDADAGDRRRAYDPQRTRSFHRERLGRERCGRRCPTCRTYPTCFSDDDEIYTGYHGGWLYRARSDARMLRDHSYLYHEHYPSEMYYYHFEDPSYYEVVGNLILQPPLSYSYFASYEY